jgi:hypothetical protein
MLAKLSYLLMMAATALACWLAASPRGPSPAAATRFVGSFPANLPAVNELIAGTEDRLVILTDYCAYGHYSSPKEYARYKRELVGLVAKGIVVDLHVYTDELAARQRANQFDFGDQEQLAAQFANLSSKPAFASYFEYHRQQGRTVSRPTSVAEFAALMEAQQLQCVQEMTAAGVNVERDIGDILPAFMWIRDDEEAIFSVYTIGSASREASLSTSEKTLVGVLADVARRY